MYTRTDLFPTAGTKSVSRRAGAAWMSGWWCSARSSASRASAPCASTVSAPRRLLASFTSSASFDSYTYSARSDFGDASSACAVRRDFHNRSHRRAG